MGALRIGVLAYPGCFASEVYGVPDLLTMAHHVAAAQAPSGTARPSYRISVLSPRRSVTAAGGFALDVAPLRPVDVLIVPGFELSREIDIDATLARLKPETEALRAQAEAGVAIASICVGAFLLAEAGLLRGRRATTSWLFADRLARRHTDVEVCPHSLVVTDRGLTTTAAFSAMFDFALGLIREHDGCDVARSTARVALVDDARTSQAPYIDPGLMPAVGQGFSLAVQRHLDHDLAARYDLPALAQSFHVSTRTLLRRFGEETGLSPLAYLQAARVARARRLLESTDRTVASIAAEVGYADTSTFSGIFTRHAGRRPREYRTMFRGRAGG